MAHFLFSPQGRISRRAYWVRFVLPLVFTYLAFVFWGPSSLSLISSGIVFFGIAFCVGIAVSVKRCHDRDRSGWFLLVWLIPLVGPIWLMIELGCLKGTVGANSFGTDPTLIDR